MNGLDEDIRKALTNGETIYDLEREEGVFQQLGGVLRGKMRWFAILALIESVVFVVLIVLAIIEFFQTDDPKWQLFYAAGVLLLAQMLVLVKVWSWMQMNRYALQREIKRLELRVVELGGQDK